MYNRSDDFTKEFGDDAVGNTYFSRRKVLTNNQVLNLFTVPVNVIPAPGRNRWVCVREAILRKPASGTVYTVGAGVQFKLGYTGAAVNFHLEINPTQLGAGAFLDNPLEVAMHSQGPSFSWTGYSQANGVITHENKGIDISAITANVTGTNAPPLYLEVWYTIKKIRW